MAWRLVIAIAFIFLSTAAQAAVSGYGAQVHGFSDYNVPTVNASDCTNGGTSFTFAACNSIDVDMSADLSNGVIGTYAQCCFDPLHTTGQSQADASYWDTITINIPNGFVGATIPLVQFHFYVTNAKLTGAGTLSNASYINATLSAIPNFTNFYAQSDHGCISNDNANRCPSLPHDLDLTVTYTNLIPVNDPKVQVRVDLTSWARGSGASADAMDPGFIEVILPEGFTFSSESNSLLTVPSVPEPASYLLVIPAGIALILQRLRRKQK